jgi:hypothetical protein
MWMMRRSLLTGIVAGVAISVLALPALASGRAAGVAGWQLAQTVHTPAGSPASDLVAMTSVSAPSADDVWAAGALESTEGDAPNHPVLEHWNGHVWTRIAMPSSFTSVYDYRVAAVSSTDVWVFNSSFKSQGRFEEKPMWAHWNGRSWTTGSLAIPALTASGLIDVAAAAAAGPDDIWVGGVARSYYFSAQSSDNPFLDFFNGRTWRVYPFPGTAGEITGISALSPADVWAVGGSPDGSSGDEVNLLLHWNGRSWQSIRIPVSLRSAVNGPGFSDVVAESSDSAWVAGLMPWSGGSAYLIPGLAHWDGTRWTVTTIPASVSSAALISGGTPLVRAVSDGGAGLWLAWQDIDGSDRKSAPGQLWHYAHGRWTLAPEPGIAAWDLVTALASVPGTDKAWAAGYTLKTRPGSGLVFRYSA